MQTNSVLFGSRERFHKSITLLLTGFQAQGIVALETGASAKTGFFGSVAGLLISVLRKFWNSLDLN